MTDHATTARAEGLVGCQRCARVWPLLTKRCARCGARLQSRSKTSLLQVWFWWLAGVAVYFPANMWPMLETRMLLKSSDDTIIAGALKLMGHGSYAVAIVILVASVFIPLFKFFVIAFLALSVHQGQGLNAKWNHRLYEIVEFIGRWSMVDVFVVAILSSLVQFSLIATVKPGPAALAFALSVIFTMISAQRFDPRLIWDLTDGDELR
ncbi:MAG: paraquat-inducible membrane protein A [Silicimonas sp.]|nr:paraquat-inducible membrane protein A [Silicimonas sp.]